MAKKKKVSGPKIPKVPGIPGRVTGDKYRVEYVGIAKRSTDAGYTNDEVANLLGVSYTTFWRWKRDHPDFRAAVAMKETTAIHRGELSAFNQMVGFYYDDEEIKVINGQIVRVPTRKFVPPDPTMTKYWLAVKAGWRLEATDVPPPPDANPGTLGETETPIVDRQMARRIMLTLYKGGKVA